MAPPGASEEYMDIESLLEEVQPIKQIVSDKNRLTVKQVVDTDYLSYAMYTISNRAIPSVIDGFKPVHRKLFYAMSKYGSGKIKCAELGGVLSSYGYNHGESSAQAAAVGLAQEWANNIPLFLQHGNFGTRLIQAAAAPRYIYVSPNPTVSKIFVDSDVYVGNVDPEDPEPHHYLPIIPWVLVNGIEGIAVGFAVEILPRSPKDLVKACEEYIKTGSVKIDLIPTFPGFKGEIKKIQDGKYSSHGKIEQGKRNSYIISELPWGYDREKYFNHLVDMETDGKIDSFQDCCDASGFNFIVKMSPTQRQSAEKDLEKYFKLSKIHSENYTTLDENGKLKIFNHVNEIIAYFCDYRIKKKLEQISFDIKKIQEKIDTNSTKKQFMLAVLEKGLGDISKMSKQEFRQFAIESTHKNADVDSLIRIPVYNFTKEEIEGLATLIATQIIEKEETMKLVPSEVLLSQMKELKV